MDKKFIGLASVFFLFFGIFMTVLVFNDSLVTLTRAKDELVPVQEKSFILAYPLTVAADGTSVSEVTVWVRNAEGKNMANKKVKLTSSIGTLDQEIINTDTTGKAVFKLSSTTPGIAEISALINDSIGTGNKVSVSFVSQ